MENATLGFRISNMAWSILLELFVKHEPFFSEECCTIGRVTMGNFCSGQCDYKNIATTSNAMKPVKQDSSVIFLQKYVCVQSCILLYKAKFHDL